jgi:hypothetical protein
LVDAVEVLFAVWVLGSIWLFDAVEVLETAPLEVFAEGLLVEPPTFIVYVWYCFSHPLPFWEKYVTYSVPVEGRPETVT